MRTREPVWITGVGTANPLGTSLDATADGFLAGRSGVRPVRGLDLAGHTSRIGAQIERVPTPAGWNESAFAAMFPAEQLFLWCAAEALRDAGWWQRRSDLHIGLILGYGAEWLTTWELGWDADRSVMHPERDGPTVLEKVQQQLELTGPATTVGAACASANLALALGRRWLDMGWVDVCLAGGGDMNVRPMCLATFGSLGALSRRNDEPARASRPFDKGRDGLVLGEGGALFTLERASQVRRRGARAYAELAGCGLTSDAFHMVIPNSDPGPAAAAMRAALADGGLAADDLDYVNAHATSTPVGDPAEARSLHLALGTATIRIPVSSTKSMTGHLLSGAAAVGAVACLAALDRQALPPTINLDEPDQECPLCHVAREARPQRVQTVLSNSFGFGGNNTSVVFRKVA